MRDVQRVIPSLVDPSSCSRASPPAPAGGPLPRKPAKKSKKKLSLPTRVAARAAIEATVSGRGLTVPEKERAAAVVSGEKSLTREESEEFPLVREAIVEALASCGVDVSKLATKLAEGLDATETKFFSFCGTICDEREVVDWKARHSYLRTTLEAIGILGAPVGVRKTKSKVQYKSHLRGGAEILSVGAPESETVKRRMAANQRYSRKVG